MSNKAVMCGLSALALLAVGGAASAQDTPMKSGAMASSDMKMSKADMKMMNKCNAMGHDKMMMDTKCKAMMDAHPGMMKDGKMTSDGMMKK
ncbi:hypothetical protein [Phenylobacterium sp.]|uniref:hypothetical protein n=1 Tax=Phenylobacterium sp. TaxID=1871053 RepID=UPI00122443E4|nr:hypothetical protein [Phenylobacterium sp.]THD63883.1 MAG: pentapeptide MXKDX repeat protein [Phenylobacterium sp.]